MVATGILHAADLGAVEQAVARLVTCDHLNGRYRVAMPVVMCTGSRVDVSVWPEPDGNFMVSDDGAAYFEVSSSSFSDRTFSNVARAKCDAYGAVFDGGTMLFMRVPADRLRGAIISMAALVKEVVDETIARATKARAETAQEALYDRLDRAFGAKAVEHNALVIGESTAEYRVDAVAKVDDKVVVFDLFTADPNSVASTFTKLSDLYRREDAPRLVGVTRSPERVGPKLQLITSVADVIRLESATERFRKMAA